MGALALQMNRLTFIKTLIITILAVFAPAKHMIYAAFTLVVADLITGLMAAKKRKEPITSSGFKRTVIKLMIYETAILLGFIAEQYLTLDILPVAKIIASFVGVTELKSVLENLNDIGGGDLLAKVIQTLNGPNN